MFEMVKKALGSGQTKAMVPVATETKQDEDIVIYDNKKSEVIESRPRAIVQFREKAISIGGKVYNIDARSLIRMIRQVTQNIGEYKNKDNPYAEYAIASLRKLRSDMVNDLERHFKISWEIEERTGRSVFYLGG